MSKGPIYLCGPMTGHPKFNYPTFKKVANASRYQARPARHLTVKQKGNMNIEEIERDFEDVPPTTHKEVEFVESLRYAINCNSMENGSNTPDFILAEYLKDCLAALNKAVKAREKWYGHSHRIGQTWQACEKEEV